MSHLFLVAGKGMILFIHFINSALRLESSASMCVALNIELKGST